MGRLLLEALIFIHRLRSSSRTRATFFYPPGQKKPKNRAWCLHLSSCIYGQGKEKRWKWTVPIKKSTY